MIEFGLSRLRAYTNGLGSGCVVTTGGVGATAVVASGYCYIGGQTVVVSAKDVDISAASPAFGKKYIFARLAAGQSSTATLDVTSVDPRNYDGSILAILYNTASQISGITTSGVTGLRPFGRARNCTVNITYDMAVARGGTLIFPNAAKPYNGNIEGTLEHVQISGYNLAGIFGGSFASAGAGSGTWTLSGTEEPMPFAVETQQITNGVTSTITLLKCYSPGVTWNIDRENWTPQNLNFQAIANSEGDVIKMVST